MCTSLHRRAFLGAAVGGIGASVLLGGLAGRAFAQAASGSIVAVPLRDGVVQLTSAGCNVVLISSGDAAALVDSGAPEHASELARVVREQTGGAPIERLFNTHWHLEHTGGNDAFAADGATIVAHENTRLWMSTEHYVDWLDRTFEPRPASAQPTDTFFSHEPQPIGATVGNEPVEYGWLREAHTDGDLYVFLPRANVLVAGGAVAAGTYPILDYATGGWIGGLEDATRKLLDLVDNETLIVPDSGPAQRAAHLRAQLEMVTTVRGRVEDLMRKGRSAEEMLAAGVTKEFDAQWGGDPTRFVYNVYNGLWWQGRLDGSL